MAIGMTYEQYWFGDPMMVRDFYEADQIAKRREDEKAWWQGAYILKALQATVGNLFLEDGAEPNRYPEMPYLREADEAETQKAKEKEEERERLRLFALLEQVRVTRKQQGW